MVKKKVWMIKAYDDTCYLYGGKKPVFRKRADGYLRPARCRAHVYIGNVCRGLLGLPAVKKGAPPVCIEFAVVLAKPKTKKAAKKRRTKR